MPKLEERLNHVIRSSVQVNPLNLYGFYRGFVVKNVLSLFLGNLVYFRRIPVKCLRNVILSSDADIYFKDTGLQF